MDPEFTIHALEMVVTIACSVLASSGFWLIVQKKLEKNDAKIKLMLGLAHDRIIQLGLIYINRGYITSDEYENLIDYLYEPYVEMGGNGTAKRIVDEVKQLEIRHSDI